MSPQTKPNPKKVRRVPRRRNVRHKRPPSNTPSTTVRLHPEEPTSETWENIAIHYLNKLKNAGKSTSKTPPGLHQTKVLDTGFSVDELSLLSASKSQMSTPLVFTEAHKKAMNIVMSALEYGQAKGLVSKNGRYFWLRNEKSLLPIQKKHIKHVPKKSISLMTLYSVRPKRRQKKYRKKAYKDLESISDFKCNCSRCRNRSL